MFQGVTLVYLSATYATSEIRYQIINLQLKSRFLCYLSRFVTSLYLG